MAPSSGGRTPFARLPPECAVGCLAILQFEDLHAVASCCKAWRALRASAPFIAARKVVDERALVLAGWDNEDYFVVPRCFELQRFGHSGKDLIFMSAVAHEGSIYVVSKANFRLDGLFLREQAKTGMDYEWLPCVPRTLYDSDDSEHEAGRTYRGWLANRASRPLW